MRRTSPTLRALLAVACIAPPAASRAQETAVTPTVRAIAGCYRIDVVRPTRSTPSIPASFEVHLDTVPYRYRKHGAAFRASPDITTGTHELPFAPNWGLSGRDSLYVSWVDGFSGPVIHLRRRGTTWTGKWRFIQDVAPYETTPEPVRAVRVPCGRGVPRPR